MVGVKTAMGHIGCSGRGRITTSHSPVGNWIVQDLKYACTICVCG